MTERSLKVTNDPVRAGIAIRPYKHGRFSGDQAGVWLAPDFSVVCMVDGLGHGEAADEAARKAFATVGEHRDKDLVELMALCDAALRGGRGAAMAIARIERESGQMEYIGVGNTRCAVVGRKIYHLGSVYGVVGEGSGDPSIETCKLERRDVVILWTDGLPETLNLIGTRVRRITNAQAFADQLTDQFANADDDAGVAVLRWDA